MTQQLPPTQPPAASPQPPTHPGAPAYNPAIDGQAAANRKGCGCARGCLIVLLALVLLVVGGGVAALTVGRSYVARQLPAWEAQQPLLGPALDLTGLRGKLASQPDADLSEQKKARQGGANDKALLPPDLVLYAHPSLEAYNISATQVTAYQRATRTLDEAYAHLVDGMAAQGWELVSEMETAEGLQLGWRKGERTCQVELVAVDGQTELWLRATP